MSELLLCGRVTEHDGDIVSVCLWSVAEFVPIGSPEHKELVRRFHQEWESKANMPKTYGRREERGISAPMQPLPVETPESKLVGRAERARTWRWLVWALAGFWMAVGLAFLWRKL